ncbi:hypothetical protein HUT18_11570 [Streptomyces sp. NA04227]|uniref:hypothetical protein n=1 Tax=Streptomyces sp. NA04227 TaxID=2742136 RepID=UPI00158FFBBA|nr:hypothetical protein [Streptomyces sp. NA04227]QKW06938.1 hypothetical protein HUT18_11570 [Streptomyces sp. NA04227]
MPCACKGKREQFEVVTEAGKVVFTSGSQPTANAVSKRYKGSSVRPKAKPGDSTTSASANTTARTTSTTTKTVNRA